MVAQGQENWGDVNGVRDDCWKWPEAGHTKKMCGIARGPPRCTRFAVLVCNVFDDIDGRVQWNFEEVNRGRIGDERREDMFEGSKLFTCVEVVFLEIRRRRARHCTWSDIDMEIGDKERCGTFSAFEGTRLHDGGSDGDDFPGHVLVHDDFCSRFDVALDDLSDTDCVLELDLLVAGEYDVHSFSCEITRVLEFLSSVVVDRCVQRLIQDVQGAKVGWNCSLLSGISVMTRFDQSVSSLLFCCCQVRAAQRCLSLGQANPRWNL